MYDVKSVDPRHGHYIAGFTDGEGSFNVSLRPRPDYTQGWKISASFNVSQKDRVVLTHIKKVLQCGTLRTRKDGVMYYEVTNITALHNHVIPFFTRFGFISAAKKKNFSLFTRIVKKMYRKEHLTREGFDEIVALREQLNEGVGRKRAYTATDTRAQ